jgi:hypothetical protein
MITWKIYEPVLVFGCSVVVSIIIECDNIWACWKIAMSDHFVPTRISTCILEESV